MNVRTDFQTILGADGKPAFVVVPYAQFQRMSGGFTLGTVPNAVVGMAFDDGISGQLSAQVRKGLPVPQ